MVRPRIANPLSPGSNPGDASNPSLRKAPVVTQPSAGIPVVPTGAEGLPSERELSRSFGQVLLRAARLYNEHAVALVQRSRDPRIRVAHTTLFPHLSAEGIRPARLAARIGTSKQAVGALVADLVAWGLVERVPDPSDGRAVVVRWTPAGADAIRDGLAVLREIEEALGAVLGVQELERCRLTLLDVSAALQGPVPPPQPAGPEAGS